MKEDNFRGVAIAKRNLEVKDVLKGLNILLSNPEVFCVIEDKYSYSHYRECLNTPYNCLEMSIINIRTLCAKKKSM